MANHSNKVFFLSGIVFLSLILCASSFGFSLSATGDSYISFKKENEAFPLSDAGKPAMIYASEEDFPGVIRAIKDLQDDIKKVTNNTPELVFNKTPREKKLVIIGTLGKSPIIDKLVKDKKLNTEGLQGKWETFIIQEVEQPMKGVERALVIAGSDKRGTIYGIYDVSAAIGVSPWYYWADVPVKQQQDIYVMKGRHTKGEPAVKYRGFFINDEAPAMSGWTHEKHGGFNHKLYGKVFELLLRMKGNYLWPAMWGNAFYDDDPLNAKLAEEYGVVIGTSHHEPMGRAHVEWKRYGTGPWNYEKNEEKLKEFWREGVKRMGNVENIVTLAMRGDGDEPMAEGTQVALLEQIVKDQREIIKEVTGKNIEEVPQVWALYKEVQDYYDKGMRVPDDVTLLLCDDNWGNLRKLPKKNEKQHKGGYGIYYHYDYVGGPRNYKWVNTNPIQRVWEQMHLAHQYAVDRIWIVNVGDIKPMEFPLEFFLDYAWSPESWPAEKLGEYTKLWAEKQFGPEHSGAIAHFLSQYLKFNSRRKPELLSPETYSLINYREAETVVEEYNQLVADAKLVYDKLPKQYHDAYYQLVMHPIEACANLNELYVTVAKNRMYASQGRAATNPMAEKAKGLFEKDAEISYYYNNVMADGKWSHMMDQTHIGYTYWQQPEENVMPEVKTITLKDISEMGVFVEGADSWWPNDKNTAKLPEFNLYYENPFYFEIFNRGSKPFNYQIKTDAYWLSFSEMQGKIDTEKRIWVSIDWTLVPVGKHQSAITVIGPDKKEVKILVSADNPADLKPEEIKGFVATHGYISMEAENFNHAVETSGIKWKTIPGLGRTQSGVTPFPVTAERQKPGGNSPRLEYIIHVPDGGDVTIHSYFSPTLDFHNNGLKYAISIDDEAPQILDIEPDKSLKAWEKAVADNIRIISSQHRIDNPGEHVVKYWMVDPAVVLQKIVLDLGGLKPSYLGPPQSFKREAQ